MGSSLSIIVTQVKKKTKTKREKQQNWLNFYLDNKSKANITLPHSNARRHKYTRTRRTKKQERKKKNKDDMRADFERGVYKWSTMNRLT